MREKGTNSPMLRGLEIIRESFAVGRVLSPSLGTSRKQSMADSQEEDVAEERELFDICALRQEDDNGNEKEEEQEQGNLIMELVEKEDAATPLPVSSSSSSFLPRYRENGVYAKSRGGHCHNRVMEMGPGLSRVYSAPINWAPYSSMAASDRREFSSPPRVDISRKEILDQEGVRFQITLRKQRNVSSSSYCSREEAIEEAWEKRRDRLVMEETNFSRDNNNNTNNNRVARRVGRSASDCGDRTWPTLQRARSRTRSLTDEDMDELRGCIDLGFGFSNDEEDLELCNTLPALELCYAITRQYNDVTGRSSPISTTGSSSSLDRCSSGSSLQSLPLESWRISSPGDHPSQVKTRLRHWAQAVACTVRQSF